MFPYIGGKSLHIKHLDNIFPKTSNTFVDVFGGAGWVSIKTKLLANSRIYNDLNPHLTNIFKNMSSKPEELAQYLNQWPKHNSTLYRQFQQDIFNNNNVKFDIETAAKYLYLQVQSYSGNTLGLKSSVYFNPLKTPQSVINKLGNLKIIERLKTLTIENLDCCEVIKKYDSDTTFFYVDPPYYSMEHYYTQEFGRHQHQILAEILNNIKGKFAISYYEFPQLLEWFPRGKFRYHYYNVSKQNSSKTNKKKSYELVITNY